MANKANRPGDETGAATPAVAVAGFDVSSIPDPGDTDPDTIIDPESYYAGWRAHGQYLEDAGLTYEHGLQDGQDAAGQP